MFSSITMASSTTKPTAMVSAISERLSRLYPTTYITAAVPRMASGTVTLGISVAATLRRNRKMTATTSAIVSTSVNSTSRTEPRMVCVASRITFTDTAGGSAARRRGSVALMRSTVSITLAPGCFVMTSTMARPPCTPAASSGDAPAPAKAQAAIVVFSGPATAVPTSRTRIGAPLRHASTTSFHGAAFRIWSLV